MPLGNKRQLEEVEAGNEEEENEEEEDGEDEEIDGGEMDGFNFPDSVCLHPQSGHIFVSDSANHRIVRLDKTGAEFTCYAGGDSEGFHDGPTDEAVFSTPSGITVAPSGDIIVADAENNAVRKICGGQVTTVAGCREEGFRDGAAANAQFNYPTDVACDEEGSIYVVDGGNHLIRKIFNGVVSTVAGTGEKGYKDGAGSAAMFNHPGGIALGKDGTIFVADYGNHRIREISRAGVVRTLAGDGKKRHRDGKRTKASFHFPTSLALSPSTGDLVVTDHGNEYIRVVTLQGAVSTLAGTGEPGFKDGKLDLASFNQARGVACDAEGRVFIVDSGNHAVRVISTTDRMTSTLAGLGVPVKTLDEDDDSQSSPPPNPEGRVVSCSFVPQTRDYLIFDKGM